MRSLLPIVFLLSTSTTLSLSLQQHPLEEPGCNGTGIVDPNNPSRCNGDGIGHDNPNPNPTNPSPGLNRPDPSRENFTFENPSTNCKWASQPYIWDSFKDLEKDMYRLFKIIHKNVTITVVGHHPIAGRYDDLMHFYVNAIRRVSMSFSEYADRFEIHPRGIYHGCDAEWSIEEMQFKGVTNSGDNFDIVNVWFTRWNHRGQMVEIRTYIDAPPIINALMKNELWYNGSTARDNWMYMPGPAGMPDLKPLEDYYGYPDGSKYED